MDVVLLLEGAIAKLEAGEYSIGLNAILRHVKSAIRHLERDKMEDPDSCTDVIFRMNQAYEGSLKEAYRVLAGKDPSVLTPHQIEQYLESHKVVRPRVLVQLSRYRQDFRNPSTHDYKLDFDADEALIAILSVCAFAILLTDQIRSRIESEKAKLRAASSTATKSRASLRSLGDRIAQLCLSYTRESKNVAWFEYDKGIPETLIDAGFNAVHCDDNDDGEGLWGEVVVKKGKSRFLIDTRAARSTNEPPEDLSPLDDAFVESMVVGGLLILRSRGGSDFQLYKGSLESKPIFVIMEEDLEQLRALMVDIPDLKVL
jgi:hypothetical protein